MLGVLPDLFDTNIDPADKPITTMLYACGDTLARPFPCPMALHYLEALRFRLDNTMGKGVIT